MKYFFLSFLFILGSKCLSQFKKPELFVETGAFVSGGKNAPFWLLSNQYGKYSNHWYNINYSAGAKALFDTSKNIDYGYGVEIMNRIDDKYTIYPHELYVAFKLWIFDIHAGWREEVFGNAYPGLTSGNLLWSGNARPMPKLSINIPEYTPLPFTFGFIEFKGNLAHGWFENDRYVKGVLMHHKSIMGRIGGKFPLTGHYGIHHFAQWGGESPNPIYGKLPSDLEAFWWIVQAKESAPGDSIGGESLNRYGNHIGSRNTGIDLNVKKWKAGFYWQTIFEDTSGKKWRNIRDGLWGIYWESKKDDALVRAVVVEYLNTTDQSGPTHDPSPELPQGGGDDNYFNNYVYLSGWTMYQFSLGTPCITSPIFTKSAYQLINTRVRGVHFGIQGEIRKNHFYLMKFYISENLGRHKYPFDNRKDNTSILASYKFVMEKKKQSISTQFAMDFENMLGFNYGFKLIYKRNFVL